MFSPNHSSTFNLKQTNTMITASLFPVFPLNCHPVHSQPDPKGAIFTHLQSIRNCFQQVLVKSLPVEKERSLTFAAAPLCGDSDQVSPLMHATWSHWTVMKWWVERDKKMHGGNREKKKEMDRVIMTPKGWKIVTVFTFTFGSKGVTIGRHLFVEDTVSCGTEVEVEGRLGLAEDLCQKTSKHHQQPVFSADWWFFWEFNNGFCSMMLLVWCAHTMQ